MMLLVNEDMQTQQDSAPFTVDQDGVDSLFLQKINSAFENPGSFCQS